MTEHSTVEVSFYRSPWRDAYDLLDYVERRRKRQMAMSVIIVCWCVFSVVLSVRQDEFVSAALWGVSLVLWLGALVAQVLTSSRIGEHASRVEITAIAPEDNGVGQEVPGAHHAED